ncbi:helix-turn-helix domain-containing protein [Candidatus Micrarchaeota archaeon]|nr:helix-turn-helix domain-containing protein [Candidatus Micrarchaeota archaeon]MBU1930293.1 helix-turn-helix domain-containing protein [Candidatus Micrarchaeota archaeon]
MDTAVLAQLGLSQKEIDVYLALLRMGSSSASMVAERTGIDRTLCYSLLDKLIDRGYVSFLTEKKVKRFSATNPSKFLMDTQVQEEQLKKLVPQLQECAGKQTPSLSIQIFKGKEGVRWFFSDFMNHQEDAYLFGDVVRFQELAPIQLEKYFRHLVENNLFEYIIFSEGDNPGIHPTQTKYRTVPGKLISSSAIWVYGKKTLIAIWSEPTLMITIENKEAADNYRAYFKFLWKLGSKKGVLSKKLGKARAFI